MPNHDFLKTVLDRSFRANPAYELIQFERLSDEHRREFKELQEEPDSYGLLWPRESNGLGVKAVCQDTALLFLTLIEAGPIPGYVHAKFGERCNQAVAELVLDGILEIADDHAGHSFVSGATAHDLIYDEKQSSALGRGRIPFISRAALQYAQSLCTESSSQLSARLYFYNTVPVSPIWRLKLRDDGAATSFLGIQPDGLHRTLLDRHWIQLPATEGFDGWLMWRSRHSHAESSAGGSLSRYKLYISPKPEELPKIWPDILAVLGTSHTESFKIGRDVYGLMRPDKIVAYCSQFELLSETANRLQAVLGGCPAQGVPFTAGIDETGLLSWGMDPAPHYLTPGWTGRESWRLWITNRLAVALLAAKAATASELTPWEFATERLGLQGVDTETWAPLQTSWKES